MTVGVGQFVDIFGDRLQEPADINLLDAVGVGDADVLPAQVGIGFAQARSQLGQFPVRLAQGLLHGVEPPVLAQDEQHASDCREGEKKGGTAWTIGADGYWYENGKKTDNYGLQLVPVQSSVLIGTQRILTMT